MSHLGAIADDFTGATDLATNLAKRGFQVVVVPEDSLDTTGRDDAQYEAVVVALKTRTAPVATAVADSLRALDYLESLGCERFYDKYCSTFDSTEEGNIGPILDALVERLGADTTVVVPSFPANGRTVANGVLSVNGELLENSSMRNHPLTPMTKSRVAEILTPQTTGTVSEIHSDTVDAGAEVLGAALSGVGTRYVVVDASTDEQLSTIAAATADSTLISGGSGLALGLSPRTHGDAAPMAATTGRQLVLSGSASTATRGQVASATSTLPFYKIDIEKLAGDRDAARADALGWIAAQTAEAPVLVYAVDSLDDLELSRSMSVDVSELVEWLLGEIAIATVSELGFTRIIVAGGETSGSVVKALGIDRLIIGPEIAPGVCWSSGTTNTGVAVNLALKSGNFGAPDMFSTAWKELA